MNMTEAEAKKKWCPFARYNGGWNRTSPEKENPRCIASACMAWRWAGDRGFCGLAGAIK